MRRQEAKADAGMTDDTISRQAAIDALGEEPLVWHEDDAGEVAERNQWRRDVAAIKALPSAQPDVPDINVGDMISKAAVLDEIHKYMEERDYTIGTLHDNICEMPSAHPSAEWIERTVSDDAVIEEWQSAKCSACGRYHTTPYMYYFDNYNYCPYCGASMRTLMISAKSWALDELEKKE